MLGLSLFLEREMNALVEVSQGLPLQDLRLVLHEPLAQKSLILDHFADLILLFLDVINPVFILVPATLHNLLKNLFLPLRG
jgi:hypothetical protein